jgi:glc operon protein GlcG
LELTWESHFTHTAKLGFRNCHFPSGETAADKIQFNGAAGLRTYISFMRIGDQPSRWSPVRGSFGMKMLSVPCVALCISLSTVAAFARGGGSMGMGMGSSHISVTGGAFGTSAAAPGTNSLGTALSSSGTSHPMKGPLLGTNPAIDREEVKVEKMIGSICRGCWRAWFASRDTLFLGTAVAPPAAGRLHDQNRTNHRTLRNHISKFIGGEPSYRQTFRNRNHLAMTKLAIGVGILAAAFCVSVRAQTLSIMSLDQAGAQTVMQAAKESAQQRNAPSAIAVVDPAGDLLAFERMDGVRPASADLAIEKARTAARLQRPTAEIEDNINQGRTAFVTADIMALRGGMPIRANGKIVGAVGIAGLSKDTDTAIANMAASALNPSPKTSQHKWRIARLRDFGCRTGAALSAFTARTPLRHSDWPSAAANRRW